MGVLDIDGSERDGAGRGDGTVSVRDGDAALYAIESDVFVVGLEDDGAEDFVGIQAVAADAEVSGDAGGFEVSAAGLKEDEAGDVLEMGGTEEVAAKIDGSGDFGEIRVAVVALNGEVAGDAVGVEAGVIVIDMHVDIAVNGVEIHISVICGESDGRVDLVDADIAVVRLDGDGGVVRDFDDEIALASVDRGDGHDEVFAFRGEDRAETLRFAFCVLRLPGIGLGVDVDVNLAVGAGARDGDVAVGVADDQAGGRVNRRAEGIVAVVAIPEDVVKVLEVLAQTCVGPSQAAEGQVRKKSGDGEHDEEEDDAASEDANGAVDAIIAAALVDGPLCEKNEPGTDEDGGPPTAVPLEGLGPGKPASFGEEKDDSDAKNDEWAEDGPAPGRTHLQADLGALHAGLILEVAALGAHGLAAVGVKRRGRRWGRRIGGHPIGRPLLCRSPSRLRDSGCPVRMARPGERQRYKGWAARCRAWEECRR